MHTSRLRLFGLLLPALALALTGVAGCAKSAPAAKQAPPPLLAELATDKGTIQIELLPQIAPKTVENFRLLAQRGYYNGLKFFRVVKDFMIQTGDPKNDGRGGESAWGGKFDDEIDRTSPLYRDGYKAGSVAMANTGPNSNTSQFFIVEKDYPLYPGFTIFGRVVKGMDVVHAIANVPTKRWIDGSMSQPIDPPILKKVTILAPPLSPATAGAKGAKGAKGAGGGGGSDRGD